LKAYWGIILHLEVNTRTTQGVAYAPEWEVVCGCMEDKVYREKWNMVKIDDPQ
jgi:hypothetical protein